MVSEKSVHGQLAPLSLGLGEEQHRGGGSGEGKLLTLNSQEQEERPGRGGEMEATVWDKPQPPGHNSHAPLPQGGNTSEISITSH